MIDDGRIDAPGVSVTLPSPRKLLLLPLLSGGSVAEGQRCARGEPRKRLGLGGSQGPGGGWALFGVGRVLGGGGGGRVRFGRCGWRLEVCWVG